MHCDVCDNWVSDHRAIFCDECDFCVCFGCEEEHNQICGVEDEEDDC